MPSFIEREGESRRIPSWNASRPWNINTGGRRGGKYREFEELNA